MSPPPTPIPADFACHANTLSTQDLRKRYGVCWETLSRWFAESGIARRRKPANQDMIRPVPADFAHHAGETYAQLRKRYKTSCKTIARWRRETGVKVKQRWQDIPGEFATLAPEMTRAELSARYDLSVHSIMVWCRRAGVEPKPTPRATPRLVVGRADIAMRTTRVIGQRDDSRAGRAADFLRRFGPVVRCDAEGRYSEKGTHYRRGSTVLSGAEIVERAERNGWDADAWRRVA